MKILITGGSGFIGSHVVKLLLGKGYRVAVVDKIVPNKSDENLRWYKLDIRDKSLNEIFKKEAPDFVVHLAAQTSIDASVKDPSKDLSVNVLGSLNVLENCRLHNVKKIVFTSTSAVYGEHPQNELPLKESHSTEPLSPYGASKMAAELLFLQFYKSFGLDCAMFRISNVYGPGEKKESDAVIPSFIRKLRSGEQAVIFGDGTQTRDFIFVEDVARAVTCVLELRKEAKSKVFNISSGIETSINELYDVVAKTLGVANVKPKYENERKGDIKRIALDNSLAKSELGWEPKINLEDGIKRTVGAN